MEDDGQVSHVVHDGSDHQHTWATATSFSMAAGVTRVGMGAFKQSRIASLRPLLNSAVTVIEENAFEGTLNLFSLEGLPPGLRYVAQYAFCDGFGDCPLRDLRGLPFTAVVHARAFGDGFMPPSKKLSATARSLGFRSIDAWVQDRRLVPCRRYAILSSVRCARRLSCSVPPAGEHEAKLSRAFPALQAEPLAPLLRRLALLPDVLVREVAEFAHGDHVQKP
jgi:hypothetical protein